jgi:hypothetical protein
MAGTSPAAYGLSSALFVYRDGKFKVFGRK